MGGANANIERDLQLPPYTCRYILVDSLIKYSAKGKVSYIGVNKFLMHVGLTIELSRQSRLSTAIIILVKPTTIL